MEYVIITAFTLVIVYLLLYASYCLRDMIFKEQKKMEKNDIKHLKNMVIPVYLIGISIGISIGIYCFFNLSYAKHLNKQLPRPLILNPVSIETVYTNPKTGAVLDSKTYTPPDFVKKVNQNMDDMATNLHLRVVNGHKIYKIEWPHGCPYTKDNCPLKDSGMCQRLRNGEFSSAGAKYGCLYHD